MWQNAYRQIEGSVHAVVLGQVGEGGILSYRTIGTAFGLNHTEHPTFITNAHVVASKDGILHGLHLVLYCPRPAMLGVRVLILERALDLAVIQTSDEGSASGIAAFASRGYVESGTPVAAVGYSMPEEPEIISATHARLVIRPRLAEGLVSSHYAWPCQHDP